MPALGVGLALAAAAIAWALWRARVIAAPDEWLLRVRDGRLIEAGIGISLWRRPGDVVARFSSTVQRVGFAVEALSRERVRVAIDAFVLWSIEPQGDAPFRAFRKLGVVNLDAPPADLKSTRHLLTASQHRAFQRLLGAALQRLAAEHPLEDLLLRQQALVEGLRGQLSGLEAEMGIRFDRIEVERVRPADEALLRRLATDVEERLREREKVLRLAQLEHEREVKAREAEHQREQAVAALQRDELQLAARLDRVRREAEASRDAIAAVASAEEAKSPEVREHELARLVAEKVGAALAALPLKEARWVTVGPQSPASSLAGLIAAARELTSPEPKRGA